MDHNLPQLIAVFIELNKLPFIVENKENKIRQTQEIQFAEHLNLDLKVNCPNCYIESYMLKRFESIDYIESNLAVFNMEYRYKTIWLNYIFDNTTNRYVFEIKDYKLLEASLISIYNLLKGYKIKECEECIKIITPSNNIKEVRFNEGWYCNCNNYSKYKTCLHLKMTDLYLSNRQIFNSAL